MILRILVLFIVIFLACGTAYLIMFKEYGLRDLLLLALFAYPMFLLRRFDFAIRTNILGSWYSGFELVLAGILVLFLLVKLRSPDSEKLRMSYPFLLLSSLVLVGLVSGIINGTSLSKYGAVVQASVRWFVPFLVASVAISAVPKTPEANARLIDSYILIYGIIAPLLIMISALFTAQVGRLMGWDPSAIGEAGFTRGWTPTGSTITSGMLIVFAYSMALTRLIRKHRTVFNAFVAALCVVSISFTLARSVMVSFVLFHLIVFRGMLWRNLPRILISFLLLAILLVPSLMLLSRRYSFERFFTGRDESMRLRWYSARAGLNEGLKNPLIGQGPGILYWDVRQPMGMFGVAERVMTVGRYASAKEPHNLYILVFAETGLIGLTLLVAALLFWLHRLNTVRKYALYVPEYLLETNAPWSMLIVFAFYYLTDSSILLYPRVALTMWFSLLVGLHSAATVENQVLASQQYDDLSQDNYYETGQAEYVGIHGS